MSLFYEKFRAACFLVMRLLPYALLTGAGLWCFEQFLRTAWVGDDAFITFRVVDNAVNGFGLRWNIAERVQAYTNPLWMLLHIPFHALDTNIFHMTLAISLFLTVATVLLIANSWLKSPLVIAVFLLLPLTLSVSWREFAVSGLENPLTFFLFAWFGWVLTHRDRVKRPFLWLFLAASLSMVNRLDTVIVYLPLLAYFAWRHRGSWKEMALGMLPLALWLSFSLFYYGFLFPNTKYAKLNTCIATLDYVRQGWVYLRDYVMMDTLGALVLCTAAVLWLTYVRRWWDTRTDGDAIGAAIGLGMMSYVGYAILVGGDFMSGRFFTLPFFIAVWLLYRAVPPRVSMMWMLLAVLALAVLASAGTQLREATTRCHGCPTIRGNGIADEWQFYEDGSTLYYQKQNVWHRRWEIQFMFRRWGEITRDNILNANPYYPVFAHQGYFADAGEESTALLSSQSLKELLELPETEDMSQNYSEEVEPDEAEIEITSTDPEMLSPHPVMPESDILMTMDEKLKHYMRDVVYGHSRSPEVPVIGMEGYFAGPRIHMIDLFGLADPLLARLPVQHIKHWRIGHFAREVPPGYHAAVETGSLGLMEPKLAQYYAKLRIITRGPLFSFERLKTIVLFNLGFYDHLKPGCPAGGDA